MTQRKGWPAAVVVCAVSLLASTACSETTKDKASSRTSTAADQATRTTRGITDTTVKVGGMIFSTFFSGADVGAKARLDRVNRDGGVHGRRIEFVGVEETNNEQAKALAIAQKLVQQQGVFALLPVTSAEVGIGDFVKREQVPFFGYGTDPAFCNNEYAFGVTGCVTDPDFKTGSNATGLALESYFKGDTDKTVAVIGEDQDAARGGVKLIRGSIASVGFHVVYAKNPVPASPAPVGDFSPFVTELMAADGGQPPDAIYGILTGPAGIGLFGALKAAGYTGLTVIPSYDPRIVTAVDGAGAVTQFAPYESASTMPRLQQMIDDVKAEKSDQILTVGVAAGYWAADMFLSLLEKTGRDLTVENLLAASDGFTYEVPGIVGRSEWPRNHSIPVPCASLVIARGGTYVPIEPLVCGKNIDIG